MYRRFLGMFRGGPSTGGKQVSKGNPFTLLDKVGAAGKIGNVSTASSNGRQRECDVLAAQPRGEARFERGVDAGRRLSRVFRFRSRSARKSWAHRGRYAAVLLTA
jgi:hypothetical protein